MIGQKVGDKLKEVIVGRQMSEVIVSIFFGALSYKIFISSISIGQSLLCEAVGGLRYV